MAGSAKTLRGGGRRVQPGRKGPPRLSPSSISPAGAPGSAPIPDALDPIWIGQYISGCEELAETSC